MTWKIAILETRHYEWSMLCPGNMTDEEILELMDRKWRACCHRTLADPDYITEYGDDVNIYEVEPGVLYQDWDCFLTRDTFAK